jgi:hypothetical protein
MILRRPIGGKAAAELASKRHRVKPPCAAALSPAPKHAVPRALSRAFARPGPASQPYRQGSNQVHARAMARS